MPTATTLLEGAARAAGAQARPLVFDDPRVIVDLSLDGRVATPLTSAVGVLAAAADACVFVQVEHEPLGLRAHRSPDAVARAIDHAGLAVLPIAWWHPRASGLDLAVRMSNPYEPERQVLGVRDPSLVQPAARALAALGVERALVVTCGDEGWIGIGDDTGGALLDGGRVRPFLVSGVGVSSSAIDARLAEGVSAALTRTLAGEPGPLAELVALNAAAVLLVAGVMPTWVDAHQWSRVRLSQGVDLSDFR